MKENKRTTYLAIGAYFAVALASYFASWIVTDTVSRVDTAVYGMCFTVSVG